MYNGYVIAAVVIAVIVACKIMQLKFAVAGCSAKKAEPAPTEYIVYGSMQCGYTVKQLEYLEKKGISFTFMDCAKGQCPASVKAFPTILKPDGTTVRGYTEL